MKNERENLAERYAIRGYCETPFVTRTSEKPEGKAPRTQPSGFAAGRSRPGFCNSP